MFRGHSRGELEECNARSGVEWSVEGSSNAEPWPIKERMNEDVVPRSADTITPLLTYLNSFQRRRVYYVLKQNITHSHTHTHLIVKGRREESNPEEISCATRKETEAETETETETGLADRN